MKKYSFPLSYRLSDKTEEEKKKEIEENLYPNIMKPFLERLEKRLNGREWFVTDKVSVGAAE